jgi:hypothetical protein
LLNGRISELSVLTQASKCLCAKTTNMTGKGAARLRPYTFADAFQYAVNQEMHPAERAMALGFDLGWD